MNFIYKESAIWIFKVVLFAIFVDIIQHFKNSIALIFISCSVTLYAFYALVVDHISQIEKKLVDCIFSSKCEQIPIKNFNDAIISLRNK